MIIFVSVYILEESISFWLMHLISYLYKLVLDHMHYFIQLFCILGMLNHLNDLQLFWLGLAFSCSVVAYTFVTICSLLTCRLDEANLICVLQGTTRPTHYHILHDEMHFAADDLQDLVHSLSYVYQRSTTAISVGEFRLSVFVVASAKLPTVTFCESCADFATLCASLQFLQSAMRILRLLRWRSS